MITFNGSVHLVYMTKHDEQTMPMFVVQKDTKKPSTIQTTYHNPLSQLYFDIDYELVFSQQVAFVLSFIVLAGKIVIQLK